MAKFYGKIGYAETKEVEEGIWIEDIVEKEVVGDLIRLSRQQQGSDTINGSLNLSNEISIVADPYAYQNYANIRYVTFDQNKWTVTNVTVEYPRLKLSIGGLYNENETT